MNEMYDDFNVLTETYYGKTDGLKKAEKLCETVIKNCHKVYEGTYSGNINDSKEVKEMEKIFAKEFNIGEFSLTFYMLNTGLLSTSIKNMNFAPNAFTYPSSMQFFKKTKENKKVADASDAFVSVNIDIALVTTLDMTPEEMMGVILHEIGHCMNATLFAFLAQLPGIRFFKELKNDIDNGNIASVLTTILVFVFKMPFVKLITQIDRVLNDMASKSPVLAGFVKQLSIIITEVIDILRPFKRLAKIANISPTKYISAALDPDTLFGYQAERFSDSFATAYGYGVGVGTFMDKLDKNKNSIVQDVNKIAPAFAIGRDLARVSVDIVYSMLDPHPKHAARIINQLNQMKRSLNDPNLDSSVRKELLYNIERYEKIINMEILNGNQDPTKETGVSVVRLMYNTIIIKVFNGKIDPRELMNVGNWYEI